MNWNEAETRFQIIDRIIIDCLGWQRSLVRLEQSDSDRGYADYELGLPRRAIWEAKRENRVFEIPASSHKKLVQDLPSVLALSEEASGAVKQVQEYCSARGVEVAVATNGRQIVAFLATRSDGIPPLEGRCLVVRGLNHLREVFPTVWQALSPDGISEQRLKRLLDVNQFLALPEKVASGLSQYPKYRYPSDLQTNLRRVGELLLIDLADHKDTEREFYEQCYCESGALSQHALISKRMLGARYEALFDQSEIAPAVTPVPSKPSKDQKSQVLLSEAVARRPTILIGDVGVGKTSFLKHLLYVSAFKEFQKALHVYIDFGSQGVLSSDIGGFVLKEIESQLFSQHDIDVFENGFVRGVYHLEVQRFERGIHASLRKENPSLYDQRLIEFLEDKTKSLDEHLRRAASHIARGRKKQIVIFLDNADQRDYQVQQHAFIVAQSLAKEWDAAVFIAIRPQTFYRSKKVGALTAYPRRVFTISPPRIDRVVERRLTFALKVAEGHVPVQHLSAIRVQLPNIAAILRTLISSLSKSQELVEFLSNITAGNIREVVEFVTMFIGSPNVNAKKILKITESGGQYQIPLHEFWKAALLGEFSYYDSNSSLALNLFDIRSPNPNEHFLAPMILAFLHFDADHRTNEGFVASSSIVNEMQRWSFTPEATEAALRRMNNKKLLETPQRVTFDEDETGLIGDMPDFFRISTIGAYHLDRWLTDFSYLDAMCYDTPIFDQKTHEIIAAKVKSFHITERFERTLEFRRYLSSAWRNSNFSPEYFDWSALVASGEESFDSVQRFIERQ